MQWISQIQPKWSATKKVTRARTTTSIASPSLFAVKGRPKADGARGSRPELRCWPLVSLFSLTHHVPKSSSPPACQGAATPSPGGQRCATSHPPLCPWHILLQNEKRGGGDTGRGMDALSKTGSFTSEVCVRGGERRERERERQGVGTAWGQRYLTPRGVCFSG